MLLSTQKFTVVNSANFARLPSFITRVLKLFFGGPVFLSHVRRHAIGQGSVPFDVDVTLLSLSNLGGRGQMRETVSSCAIAELLHERNSKSLILNIKVITALLWTVLLRQDASTSNRETRRGPFCQSWSRIVTVGLVTTRLALWNTPRQCLCPLRCRVPSGTEGWHKSFPWRNLANTSGHSESDAYGPAHVCLWTPHGLYAVPCTALLRETPGLRPRWSSICSTLYRATPGVTRAPAAVV